MCMPIHFTMSIVNMLYHVVMVSGASTGMLLVFVWGVMCPCMFQIIVNTRPDDEESVQVVSL
jgi:hypothetical protein